MSRSRWKFRQLFSVVELAQTLLRRPLSALVSRHRGCDNLALRCSAARHDNRLAATAQLHQLHHHCMPPKTKTTHRPRMHPSSNPRRRRPHRPHQFLALVCSASRKTSATTSRRSGKLARRRDGRTAASIRLAVPPCQLRRSMRAERARQPRRQAAGSRFPGL